MLREYLRHLAFGKIVLIRIFLDAEKQPSCEQSAGPYLVSRCVAGGNP